MNIDKILKYIDSLAPLSNAIVDIQKLYSCGEEDLNIDKLISLIESDLLLSVNILKMANSPIYGFSSRISSVSQAVTLFGIMQIYGFIMSYVVNENIKANTKIFGFSNEKFNDMCNIQSALLFKWYSKINLEDAKFLAPLALIMETGKLVIAYEVSASSYEEEFKQGFKKTTNIEQYEYEILETTSYEISSRIFNHWSLEPLYIEILKGLSSNIEVSDKIKKYIDILNIIITAVNLKSVMTKDSVLKACVLIKKMGLDPNDFANVALSVKKSYINELKEREKSKL